MTKLLFVFTFSCLLDLIQFPICSLTPTIQKIKWTRKSLGNIYMELRTHNNDFDDDDFDDVYDDDNYRKWTLKLIIENKWTHWNSSLCQSGVKTEQIFVTSNEHWFESIGKNIERSKKNVITTMGEMAQHIDGYIFTLRNVYDEHDHVLRRARPLLHIF